MWSCDRLFALSAAAVTLWKGTTSSLTSQALVTDFIFRLFSPGIMKNCKVWRMQSRIEISSEKRGNFWFVVQFSLVNGGAFLVGVIILFLFLFYRVGRTSCLSFCLIFLERVFWTFAASTFVLWVSLLNTTLSTSFFCLLDCLVLAILTFLIWFAWWELDSGRVWSLVRNVMRYRFFFCLFLVSRDEKVKVEFGL